jgi:hypothetical protein
VEAMINKHGCPPGYRHKANMCEKIRYPVIGSSLVPNVVDKLGCDYVNGKWDEDYSICISEEDARSTECVRSGETAPIKGVSVNWSMLDAKNCDDFKQDGDDFLSSNISIFPVVRKGGMFEVVDDAIYDDEGGLSQYTPYCYWGHDEADEMYQIIRHDALSLAEAIRKGEDINEYVYGLRYMTPDGRPCSPNHSDAVLSDIFFGEKRCEYKIKDRKKPFKVRR